MSFLPVNALPYTLLAYPFVRVFAFFFLSPLFLKSRAPFLLKLAPTLIFTLILTIALPQTPSDFSFFFLVKELIWGYFLGFFLKILLEAALLAGELLGSFLGLSLEEVLGVENRSPLLGRFFLLLTLALAIAMDLHHPLLKLFFSPPSWDFSSLSWAKLLSFSGQFFPYAFQLVFLPFFIYAVFLLLLTIASKMVPEIPLFFLSPPLQLFLGVIAILLSLNHFPSFIQKSFYEILGNFWMTLSSAL